MVIFFNFISKFYKGFSNYEFKGKVYPIKGELLLVPYSEKLEMHMFFLHQTGWIDTEDNINMKITDEGKKYLGSNMMSFLLKEKYEKSVQDFSQIAQLEEELTTSMI